jgi:hypothetical protein
MTRVVQAMTTAVALTTATIVWAQQPKDAVPLQAAATSLANIEQRLASDDFSQRAAAQRELEQLPPESLQQLREAVARQKDEEVRARLAARISDLELYHLLHPPNVAVDVKQARATDLANELSRQMGGAYVTAAGNIAGDLVTLKAEGPLWEVLRQYNERSPINISMASTPPSPLVAIRLVPVAGGAAAANRRRIAVIDGFGITTQASYTPGSQSWTIRTTLYADPRIRITRYASTPQIDKAIDGDGRQLPPATGNPTVRALFTRPTSSFTATISIPAVRDVTMIRELQGVLVFEVAEKEKTVKVNVVEQPMVEVPAPFGRVIVKRDANGDVEFRCLPPEAEAGLLTAVSSVPGGVQVYLFGKSGTIQGSYLTTSSRGSTTFKATNLQDPITTLEVSFVEKTREVTLPFRLTDIEVPPMP